MPREAGGLRSRDAWDSRTQLWAGGATPTAKQCKAAAQQHGCHRHDRGGSDLYPGHTEGRDSVSGSVAVPARWREASDEGWIAVLGQVADERVARAEDGGADGCRRRAEEVHVFQGARG